jgi:hypothetical protein
MGTAPVVVLILLFALQVSAAAQSFLYAALSGSTGNSPTLLEIPVTATGITTVSRRFDLAGEVRSGLEITSDGRFVVWLGGTGSTESTLRFFDRHTGAVGDRGRLWPFPAIDLLSDPRALRVFAVHMGGLTIIDAHGPRFIGIPGLSY